MQHLGPREVDYTWGSGGFSGAIVPDTITTTNDAGQQSKIQYGYDTYWGQTTDVYEYDFGLQLKRHTVTTYLNGANVNTSVHIFNLPTQVVVKDGSGNTVARTDMAYDSTSITAVTGAAGHDDSGYSASFTTRGNLTSVTRYSNASAGTGALTRTFSYDSLGNMISAQLDCCNQKAFNFSSTTQYSSPDSVVRGPSGTQFTSSYTYDPDTGLLLTSTDENGQTTSYQYDSMNRTTRVTLPPQGGTSVQTNTAYDDTVAAPTVTSSNTANSAVSVTTVDGLGHVMQIDSKNGTTAISSVKYAYDRLWQRTQASNPFGPSDTVVNTAFAYDPLGRVTQVTPPSGTYSQYQYSGNTVTITDSAGKQRKNYSDAMGRLIRVDEPGETFAGTPVNGTLTIGGTLRGQTGSGSPASGSVTISGFEQSTQVDYCQDWGGSCPQTIWDSGTVSITVNGHTDSANYSGGFTSSTPTSIASDLASAINGDSAASVTASASAGVVTLTAKTAGTVGNGYSLSVTSATNDVPDFGGPSFYGSASGSTLSGGIAGTTSYDSGTVNVTVGSFTASAPYSQSGNSTAAQVATALLGTGSTGLNRSSSPLIATASGATITLTYKAVGATGMDITAAATSSTNDSTHFPGGSFSGSNTLTDGQNAYSSGLANPYSTTYTYDLLDNLTAVSQAAGNVGGQPAPGQGRSYTYDSMSRPTSATTPESGTTYTYYTDSSGNACSGDAPLPCRVQDARGIVKTFTYDGINRPTGVSYSSSAAPTISYIYATGVDRLAGITEGSNSQTFTYDNFGRTTSVAQIIDGTTYTTSYGYNLASQLVSITYPSGRTVAQNVDGIGRLSSIASNGTTHLSNLSYNAAGETLGLTLGNNVLGAFTYNDHLQMSTLHYYKGTTDILDLAYDYGTNNNGQIQTVHYYSSSGTEDTNKSESFTYDPWSRLSQAQTVNVNSATAGTWKLKWGYDRFGNRLSQTLLDGNVSIGQPVFTVDPATNRIQGAPANCTSASAFCYDAAGNLLNDGVGTYSYDGANRLTQIGSGAATYTYFGVSRIKKVVGSTTTIYIYFGSKPIAEYVGGSLSKEYIYAGSDLLATIAGGSTTYHHPDHLSNRAETDVNGNPVRSYGNFPFGETWYETAADKLKFTSYENDSATGETGLNYAQFRYHAPGQGRFMSADLMSGKTGAPQSLNRYSYAMNDPVNLIDPLGLESSGSLGYGFGGGCIWRTFSDSRGGWTDVMYDWEAEICLPGDEHTGFDYENLGGGGNQKKLWQHCLDTYGDWYAKKYLTEQDFEEADAAAGQAGIETSTLLALWDNESHFNVSGWANSKGVWTTKHPYGERGPLQVRPNVAKDLQKHGVATGNWSKDFDDNLLAAANYYALLQNSYHIPAGDVAMAYNAGPTSYRHNNVPDASADYQNNFDNNKMMFDNLVKCLHGVIK